MDVQPSTKSYQLQEEGEGAKQPPDKGSAPGSRWGLRPYPLSYRIYGWMTTDMAVGPFSVTQPNPTDDLCSHS